MCRLDKQAPLVKKPKLQKDQKELKKKVREKAAELANVVMPQSLELTKQIAAKIARRVQLQVCCSHITSPCTHISQQHSLHTAPCSRAQTVQKSAPWRRALCAVSHYGCSAHEMMIHMVIAKMNALVGTWPCTISVTYI